MVLFLLMSFSVAIANAATLTIRPDAQGARTGWANTGCSSGSNEYKCVDEVLVNTSDYLSDTGTSKETFTFSNSGLSSQTINSVTLYYYAMWQTSSANSCFQAMTRSGGVDFLPGVQLCAGANWSTLSHAYTTNPATGNAWNVSSVDALEAGMAGLNPNGGGRVSQVYAVVDYDSQPVADANAVPTSGVVPLAVNFTGSVTGGDSPLTYFWNFQDGTNSTSQNPQHTFTSAGIYNVSFKVTDNDGDISTDYVLITVNDPFDFSVAASPSSGTVLFGKNISTNFTVTLVSGVSQSVSLSYTGCPTSATCSFTPGSVTPTATSVFKVATTTSTPPGVYVVNLTGAGDGKERSGLYTVTVTAPDLIIEDIEFAEYDDAGNGSIRANVTVTVKNQGTANAGSFYVRSEHFFTEYAFISSLNTGQSTIVTANYVCSSAHNFNVTADGFGNMVTESDETNNFGGPVYIDCVI